jgi:putative ABC transport system permease protein
MAAGRVLIGAVLPLAVRHVLHRRRVTGVALLGLACGVASIAATQALHRSVVASYATTTRRFAGRAALEVSNGDSGVPEELVDEVRAIAGVRAVAASVAGFVATPDLPGERLYLFGVDLLADHDVRDYGAGATAVVSDPMVFLAAPDSVALTDAFLRAHGLAMHDRVRVLTPSGNVSLTVRAVLGRQEGPATVLDGRLAVVDLSVAQDLLRLERRVSQLAIAVDSDRDVDEVSRRVAAVVGARGVVERPRARAASFARLLDNYRNGLAVAAAVGVLVALYFVTNVATITVEERRREMALLRAVGASSRVVAALVVGEMLVVGLAAVLLGVPLGVAVARGLLARFVGGIALLYGEVGPATLSLDRATLATSVGVGLVAALAATIVPVRRVLRIRPVDALRARSDPREARFPGGAGMAGTCIAGGALAAWSTRDSLPFARDTVGMAAIFGVLAGVAVALPAIARLAASTSDRLARRCSDVALVLAGRFLGEDRQRIAVTCAAMTIGVGGSIAVATWASSLDATLEEAFDAVFGRVDVVVSGGADPFAREAVRLPASVAAALATWPEISFADALRIDTIAFEGSRAAIVARDASAYVAGRRRLFMVEGDASEAARRVAAGTAVVVNRAFARRFGRKPGDVIELATPNGPLRLPIAGIHLELTPGDLGVVQLDRALYRRWWRDDTLSLVEIELRHPADRPRVLDAIRGRFGERYGLVAFTVEELRRTYEAMLGRLAALVRPLLALALGCALVGLVSASTAAMIVRRRTYALLRAVGCTRAQLTRATIVELAMIGGLAMSGAVVIGAGLGWVQVEVLLRGMLGMAVAYAFPRNLAAGAAVAVVVATALAGWVLGRRAGKVPIRAALQTE